MSGVSMQSFLVGQDLNGCAFVYGSLSFLDKILCGLALSVLESYQSKFLQNFDQFKISLQCLDVWLLRYHSS